MSDTPDFARKDLAALRQRLSVLAQEDDAVLWRGLEELAATPEMLALLEDECFDHGTDEATLLDRRRFLQLMGASLAMAGLAACGQAPEEAVPRVEQPEQLIPGKSLLYATAITFAGYGQPVLGKTRAGRPIKLEGNARHPLSGGSCDAFTQAAILQLYDPDRSQAPRYKGRETTWGNVQKALLEQTIALDANQGLGLHVASGASSSPTLARQLAELKQRWPQAQFYHAETFAESARIQACSQVGGRPRIPRFQLGRAEVVVSLDDDLLGPGPHQVEHQQGWAQRRRAAAQGQGGALLFVAEGVPSLTGAAASQRLRLLPSEQLKVVAALARGLGDGPSETLADPAPLNAEQQAWLRQVVTAVKANPQHSLICAGSQTPVEVQAAVIMLNQQLGNQGTTLVYQTPVLLGYADNDHWGSLNDLSRHLGAGEVESLILLDCNPVQTASVEWADPRLLERVPFRLHAGLYYDESAAQCHWHLPLNHALDGWSDARAADGSSLIVQPLIEPLYATRTLHQVLELWLSGLESDGLALVRKTWSAVAEDDWRQALSQGWIEAAAVEASAVEKALADPLAALRPVKPLLTSTPDTLEAQLKPDPCVWDGRFANLGWLQELPKPVSKLTWSNVIGVSPALAERLALHNGDVLEVELNDASCEQLIQGAVWIEPGQAEQLVALYAGYGRTRAGRVGNDLGYDVRPFEVGGGVSLRKLEGHIELACTQLHHRLQPGDAPPIRTVSRNDPVLPASPVFASLFSPAKTVGPQWGMVIDLDTCTGCNACVVACQAENNIAVVGAEQVRRGRAMHWLRIDHYYQGNLDTPRSAFQPLPCMHCEQAPCEVGCPVNATVHGSDGLNQMVYNRCIGTRTCASFCPYKVRRFNWFNWSADAPPSIQAQRNPEVTVRSRGVMEKCTYCIQRVSAARIDERISAGQQQNSAEPVTFEVVTACQQTCPSQAIHFGNIADPASDVSQARGSTRHYSLLEELNTRPRTTYLAQIDEALKGDGHE